MGKILYAEQDGIFVLRLEGDVRVTLGPTITTFLDNLVKCSDFNSVIVDLRQATGVDSTALGLLAKISIKCKSTFDAIPTIVSTNEDITRILMSMGFDQVSHLVKELPEGCCNPGEIPEQWVSEDKLREQVLEAHKILMSLNEHNRLEFKDLVEALEHERDDEAENPDLPPRRAASC